MKATLDSSAEITIDRPPADVWSVVSDYAADQRWRRGIVEMTPDRPGAPQVGTRVREVLRLGGRDYVTDSTVTEAGPGMSYRFAGRGTSGEVHGGRSVRERPGGTLFRYEVQLTPAGIPRPVAPLAAWWLRRSLRRDLVRLRALLEAR